MDSSSMPNEQPEQLEPNPEEPSPYSEPQQPAPEAERPQPEPQPETPPAPPPETPPAPQPETTPEPQPETPPAPGGAYKKPGLGSKLPQISDIPRSRLIAAGAIAIILIVLAIVFSRAPAPPTTTITTTVQQVNLSQISSCRTLNSSGTYYLSSNINYSSAGGACIKIAASNVRLYGNGHSITGSGPYTGLPPYSYGVDVLAVSNVTVSNIRLSRFSYDIALNGTSFSTISDNNLTMSTLSDIYLSNAHNNTIQRNTVSHSQSSQGGIYMKSGSGNMFYNNTISNNAYYGLVVNSTLNKFSHNNFASNPADLVCNQSSASRYSNSFSSSKCTVNDYCGFASCSTNVPFNVSSIRLSPGAISTCGSIVSPGNYTLAKSISAATYLNTSNPLARGVSCIQILAPNVNFNCAGKQINNSGYGIYIGASSNVNVSNCVLYNNNYGIASSSAFSPRISNTTAINNTYGLFIGNTTGGKISNVRVIGNNTYGLYLNSSSGVLTDNIKAQNNTYGVFVNGGGSDVFSGGVADSNKKIDVYCTPSVYNSTTNLAQSLSCGLTDCSWASASCKQYVQPTLSLYPISSCGTILRPGNYSLAHNLLASGSCFNIAANNINFNCNSHVLTGQSPAVGSAFSLANRKNVTLTNCAVTNFAKGINVTNSSLISISNFNINNTGAPVAFSHVWASSLSNVNSYNYRSVAFSFSYVNTTTVSHDNALIGVLNGSGFSFYNSDRNNVYFNNATNNPKFGFNFSNSENDTVYNNSAFNNGGSDYVCSGASTGLYSNPISVDFGLSKSQCRWIVAVSPLITGPTCQAIFAPTLITFTRDLLYTSAATCFSIYTTKGANATSANNTVINCNGHTAYAPKGGIFAAIAGAANVKIDNCLLWNFTTGVQSNGLGTIVYNNTFAAGGNAVVLNGGRFTSIYHNTVDNNTNGIIISNVSQVSVYNNKFFNNTLSIALFNSTFSTITNNTAINSGIGLYFGNTTQITIQNNYLWNSSVSAIKCVGTSVNSTSKNLDYGGNVCLKGNTTTDCAWIKSSTSCV